MPQHPADFGLDSGTKVKAEIARAWADVQDSWRFVVRHAIRGALLRRVLNTQKGQSVACIGPDPGTLRQRRGN